MPRPSSSAQKLADVPSITRPSDPLHLILSSVVEECASGVVSLKTAKEATLLLENVRQGALESNLPISLARKLFLVKAGELVTETQYFAENARYDASLSEEINIRKMKTLAEDCLILSREEA